MKRQARTETGIEAVKCQQVIRAVLDTVVFLIFFFDRVNKLIYLVFTTAT